ncbi:MAG: hypothetical protein ACE5GW_02675 [Planctomycetota bacterium]
MRSLKLSGSVLAAALALVGVLAAPQVATASDCNGDGGFDIGDPVFLLNFLFAQGPTPPSISVCDANADFSTDIADAIYMLWILFP